MKKRRKNNYTLVAGLFLLTSSLAFLGRSALFAQEAAPSGGVGKVAGKVRLEGRFKKPAPLKVYKNRDFCGAEVPNESLIVAPQGGLKNVVVIIHGQKQQKTDRTLKDLFLDNKNCAFVPHVQVAPVGSEILLLNSDPILHDVHARIGSETLFNVGLPTWRQVTAHLSRTGIVAIECDVLHTWMTAYIVVTSSPYFAITNERGEFVIEGVPAGTYEMEIWHEKLGSQSRRVTVTGDAALSVDLVYRLGK
ncbi:MAG: hypothetical protein HY694_12650 [Deltaproteobacteria bacterium]|nr:hypothetical protein [Deltaproteobacteria bacterium]